MEANCGIFVGLCCFMWVPFLCCAYGSPGFTGESVICTVGFACCGMVNHDSSRGV